MLENGARWTDDKNERDDVSSDDKCFRDNERLKIDTFDTRR